MCIASLTPQAPRAANTRRTFRRLGLLTLLLLLLPPRPPGAGELLAAPPPPPPRDRALAAPDGLIPIQSFNLRETGTWRLSQYFHDQTRVQIERSKQKSRSLTARYRLLRDAEKYLSRAILYAGESDNITPPRRRDMNLLEEEIAQLQADVLWKIQQRQRQSWFPGRNRLEPAGDPDDATKPRRVFTGFDQPAPTLPQTPTPAPAPAPAPDPAPEPAPSPSTAQAPLPPSPTTPSPTTTPINSPPPPATTNTAADTATPTPAALPPASPTSAPVPIPPPPELPPTPAPPEPPTAPEATQPPAAYPWQTLIIILALLWLSYRLGRHRALRAPTASICVEPASNVVDAKAWANLDSQEIVDPTVADLSAGKLVTIRDRALYHTIHPPMQFAIGDPDRCEHLYQLGFLDDREIQADNLILRRGRRRGSKITFEEARGIPVNASGTPHATAFILHPNEGWPMFSVTLTRQGSTLWQTIRDYGSPGGLTIRRLLGPQHQPPAPDTR